MQSHCFSCSKAVVSKWYLDRLQCTQIKQAMSNTKCMFACILFSEAGFKNVGFKIFQVNCYLRGSL